MSTATDYVSALRDLNALAGQVRAVNATGVRLFRGRVERYDGRVLVLGEAVLIETHTGVGWGWGVRSRARCGCIMSPTWGSGSSGRIGGRRENLTLEQRLAQQVQRETCGPKWCTAQ